MQFVLVIILLFLLYQFWTKRREAPVVKKHKHKGDVIDIDAVRHEDIDHGPLPYKKRPYLQERSERLMFEGLKEHLQDYSVVIYPQVDMLKLLYVPQTEKNFMAYINRIAGKSANFAVCDCQTLEPLIAICLEKVGTDMNQRKESDLFVDRAFEKAGLPLVRFIASDEAYAWEEIINQLQPYLYTQTSHTKK